MDGFPLREFLTAFGLALVLEGALWLVAPEAMRRFMRRVAELSGASLRLCGLMAALLGLLTIWIVRQTL